MTEQRIMTERGWGESACRRAVVLHPVLRGIEGGARREPATRLEEATGLALAIDLEVVHSEILRVGRPRPDVLIGGGALDRLAELIESAGADLVIVDHALSPVQQRNLERRWQVKVIDRTGLILEIFGARARTHEGRLQVELAAMHYARSRLVRSWTHLERQRGGLGFVGGPGESQIEIDRRLIGDRIARLTRQLDKVRRTRGLQRAARKRVPYPIVALAGYTNAGKSTLFNYLAGSRVLAKDMLFATLDTSMRAVNLPSGRQVILSDTVGFISDLPTELVAAFRATLEEVTEADIIVHVRDIACADTAEQKRDVAQVLKNLGLDAEIPVIEALNKTDLLPLADAERIANQATRHAYSIALSARTGEGGEALLGLIDDLLTRDNLEITQTLSHSDGRRLAWLYQHGEVLHRTDGEEGVEVRVSLLPKTLGQYEQLFGIGPQSTR